MLKNAFDIKKNEKVHLRLAQMYFKQQCSFNKAYN